MASKNARAKRKQKEQQDILQAGHNQRQKLNPLPTINDPYGADVVSLEKASLGQLRLNYRPQHDKVLPHRVTDKVRREYARGEFRTIHASDRHTLIHGFDNATLVYRVPASDSVRNETLLRSIQNLPAAITDDYEQGTDRGQFNRRHYCVWCSYAQEPFVSKQFTKDGEAAVEFMRMTEPIWEEMTTHLQALFPLAYKEFTSIPLESHLRRMCGAWMGCVVSYQDDDGETGPVVTQAHRDVKERVFGVSCLCPFGDWEGGNLILWELKLIIELRPGDLLFFPDALIHHSNEAVAVGGQRNSVVAFTQQNMFDYWKRQDGQGAIKIGDSEFTDFPPALGDDDYAEGVAPPQNLRSGREYDGSRIVYTLDDKRMKQLKQRRRQEKRRKKAAADAKTVPRFYRRLMPISYLFLHSLPHLHIHVTSPLLHPEFAPAHDDFITATDTYKRKPSMSKMKIQHTYGREFPASSAHAQTFNAQMSSFDSGFVTPSAPVVRQARQQPQISACSNGDPHPNQRLEEVEQLFVEEMAAKDAWPLPLPDPRAAYQAFRERMMELSHTLVCACCACLSHDSTQSTVVSSTYAPLSLLAVLAPARVPYDFSCGVATIDQRHIMLQGDAVEMLEDGGASITLCVLCKAELDRGRLPKDALANRRWVGKVPKELEGLTWLEERLVARAHASGGILRLQRGSRDAYMGIKGHMVVCPQDTRELLDILPLPPSRLPDYIRVVWTGAIRPTPTELNSKLSVRTARVYAALLWLCAHNEDYGDVTIDHAQFDTWPPVFVVAELIDSMGHISDNLAETIARTGAATENDMEDGILDNETTSSGMLDVNDVTQSSNSGTLRRLATLTKDSIVNVVKGSVLRSQYDDPAYFTACFPTIFPYGCGKHLDPLRTKHLSLEKWTSLLLRHCSRRFQSNAGFVVLCFDVSRRQQTIIGSCIQTKRRDWEETQKLINSLTAQDLVHASQRAEAHQPLENPAVKSLLQAVNRIGFNALGSDARKFNMFSQLQSSVVRFGFPVIYLTLNPAEKCSPLALSYAGVEIDISDFEPEHHNLQQRMKTMLDNPLAVVEYFHTTVDTLLKTLLKDSLFGTLTHHFGTIEYQGRGSPHIHLLLWLSGTTTPEQLRTKASVDPLYCTRLLQFITAIACECLPTEHVDVERGPRPAGERAFLPFLDPALPEFRENMDVEVSDIVRHRQIHSNRHTATCFKLRSRECRFRFPRQLVETSSFDSLTGVVHIERDDCWLNGFNPWISLAMRTNHDVQFLLTKDHAIAIMYYIIKYISKDEQSLHSKLAIAAAVRASQLIEAPANTVAGKQMIQRFYNKIQSHREVGLPEAVSHLLQIPDHYTSGSFVNINTTQLRSYFKHRSHHVATTFIQGLVEGDEIMVESEITRVGSQYKLINAFDDYNYRGADFDRYCLYEYGAMYHKSKGLQGFPFTSEHMQHRHCSQVSNIGPPQVPNLLGALFYLNRHSKETSIRNDFFCILTALFVPWAFDSPVKAIEISWEEHFLGLEPLLPTRVRAYISNIELLHKSKEESIIDRLQRPHLTDASYFHNDDEDEPSLDFNMEPRSPESLVSFEATAAAIRSFQNTIDLYTTEAVDASQEYGYVGAPPDPGDMDVVTEPAINISIRSKADLKASVAASKVSRSLAQERQTRTRMTDIVDPSVHITDEATKSCTQSIIAEFSLNEEQRRAFCIATGHASSAFGSSGQLLMGIFGEGGTGKSRLIDAIRAWFDTQDRGEELMVTAMTGSAASHIGGSTLHSATGIRVEKGERSTIARAIPKKAAEWCNVRYLIIDEVSMIDRDIVMRLEIQLQLLTSNATAMLGGMNILFCGDFLQFPCCSHLNVYDGGADLLCSKGHDLWRSLNAGVILRQQMRQSEDPVWAALLHRLRMRCPTDEDIELLISRIGAPLTHTSSLPPAIIVRRHTVRIAINNCKIKEMSDKCNIPITYCVADIVGKTHMHHQEIYEITYPKKNVLSDAVLALVPGVPLMLTKNVDIPLGLTNGAIVEFVGFAGTIPVNPGDTISPSQHMLLIRIDPKYSCDIDGLPHNVFALDWETFTYYAGDGRKVTLHQFGVVLAFAITDYKCQGQTFYSIVVDLRKPVGFASTASFYVQLSRCRTLAEVSIIRSFDPAELRRPHSQALLAELDWQESLDREGIRNFGAGGI